MNSLYVQHWQVVYKGSNSAFLFFNISLKTISVAMLQLLLDAAHSTCSPAGCGCKNLPKIEHVVEKRKISQNVLHDQLQLPCTETEWLVARVKRFLKVDVKKKAMMNDTDNTDNTNSECDNVLGDHFEAEKQSLRICSALMRGIFAGTCKNKALRLLCHARIIEGLCKIIKVYSHSSNNRATSRFSRLKQMNGRDLLALAKKKKKTK